MDILTRLHNLPPSRFHYKLLVLVGIGWLFDAMDTGLVSFVLPALGKDWALAPAQLGWIVSIAFVGMALGAVFSGWLADRFGRRTVFAGTMVVYSIATGLCALAPDLTVLLVCRFFVGVGLAKVLGLDPLIGLITGSITLTGGHGTAGAWGPDFENKFGLVGATGLGMASATFGLVFGGLIGGPVARRLINKMGRKPIDQSKQKANADEHADDVFEQAKRTRLITAESAVETLAMFAACLAFAEIVDGFDKEYLYDLPKFVWCLFAGVVIRNILTSAFKVNMFDRAIDVFGNASLSLFLAMALLNLKLWELTGLAGPVTIILAVQTVVMILYATFATYVFMGRDYDAAGFAGRHRRRGPGAAGQRGQPGPQSSMATVAPPANWAAWRRA